MSDDPRDRMHPRDTRHSLDVAQVRRAATLDAAHNTRDVAFAELERVRSDLEELVEELVTDAMHYHGYRDYKWRLRARNPRAFRLMLEAIERRAARGPVGTEQPGRDRVTSLVADALAEHGPTAPTALVARHVAEQALRLR